MYIIDLNEDIKLYIDFDGIIVDTWPIILSNYYNKYLSNDIDESKLKKFFFECDWKGILDKSQKNQDNIKFLKKISNYGVTILTKVNSYSEIIAKKDFLKENNINISLIAVDYAAEKANVVDAKNNILIDDEIKNLKYWRNNGGIGILYSKNNDNYDSNGILNEEFPVISSLKDICSCEISNCKPEIYYK